jgi:hypothetical protein
MSPETVSDLRKDSAKLKFAKAKGSITYRDLVQLLLQLDNYHREKNGQAYGSITLDSIKRNDQHQIVLDFHPNDTSLCESTLKDDPDASRFVNVGEVPKPVDDLTSLGVAVAELIIPINQRPPREGDYRNNLVSQIEGGSLRKLWRFCELGDGNRRDRLIVQLLKANSENAQTIAGFMHLHAGLLNVSQKGFLQPALRFDVVRAYPIGTLTAIFVFCLMCFFYQRLVNTQERLKASTSQSLQFQQDLKVQKTTSENLNVKKGLLEGQIASLEGEVASLDKKQRESVNRIQYLEEQLKKYQPVETPPAPHKYPVKLLTDLDYYQLIKDDPFLTRNDPRTKNILRLDKATREDLDYVRSRMITYKDASKEWWRWVDKKYSETDIERQIQTIVDDDVVLLLRQWLAQSKEKPYEITISEIKDPNGYQKYLLTLNYEKSGKLRKFQRGENNKAEFTDKPNWYDLKWKYGDSVTVYWEQDGWVKNKDLIANYSAHGHLSLIWLSSHETKRGKYGISFNIPGLPGPEREATKSPVYPVPYDEYDKDNPPPKPEGGKPKPKAGQPGESPPPKPEGDKPEPEAGQPGESPPMPPPKEPRPPISIIDLLEDAIN